MNDCQINVGAEGVKLSGPLNFNNVKKVYKGVIGLLTTHNQLSLDFAGVVAADSSAIALLLGWVRFANKNQKSLNFLNLPAKLVEIANVCEVMPLLESHLNSITNSCETNNLEH